MRDREFSHLVACCILLSAMLPATTLNAQFNDTQNFDTAAAGSVFAVSPAVPNWSLAGGCSGAIVFSDGKHGDNGTRCLRSFHPVGVGTRMIRDLNPGPGSSTIAEMAYSGLDEVYRLWVSADTGSGSAGRELYRVQSFLYPVTSLEMDIYPGSTASDPTKLFRMDPGGLADVFFSADDGSTGREPWLCRTDANFVPTTSSLADGNSGAAGSEPDGFAVVGNGSMKGVVFAATSASDGRELWFSDGNGMSLLQDINTSSPGASSSPQLMSTLQVATWVYGGPYDAKVFFTADDGSHGRELWRTDGTSVGTGLVKDIIAGATGSNPTNLLPVRLLSGGVYSNVVLFTVNSDGVNGMELWKSGGALNGSDTVMLYNPGAAGSPANLTSAGALYKGFFTIGKALWKTDGTAAGTALVKTFSSTPSNFCTVGDKFYFTADDGTGKGVELWVSVGTASYTRLVKDINPGTATSAPMNLTTAGSNLLYFTADDGTSGRELWKTSVNSDWTSFPTSMVADVNPGAGSSSPANLTYFDGGLVFTADDGTHGRELWQTDGSAAPPYSGMNYKWDLSALIQSKGDPAKIAVAGVDDQTFSVTWMYDFPSMGGADGVISEASHEVNTYVELAGGSDRAPLPVTSVDCGDGSLPRPSAALTDGNHHDAIAFGMVSVLDQNPCDTDARGPGSPGVPFANVPAVYDGHDWIPMDRAHIPPGMPSDPPAGPSLAQAPFGGFLPSGGALPAGLAPASSDPWTTKRFCSARITVWTDYIRVTWASKQLGTQWVATLPRQYKGAYTSLYIGNSACLQSAYSLYLDSIQLNGGVFTTSLDPFGACCIRDTGSCVPAASQAECTAMGGDFSLFRGCGDIQCLRACGVPFADFDHDHDVDQDDFGMFQVCFTGQGGGILNHDCGCFDRDPAGAGDHDVDVDDFQAWKACVTGPGVPFDPANPGLCVP